jgi:hypothetical protein
MEEYSKNKAIKLTEILEKSRVSNRNNIFDHLTSMQSYRSISETNELTDVN